MKTTLIKQFMLSSLLFGAISTYSQEIDAPPKWGLGMEFDDEGYDAAPDLPSTHKFVEILPPASSLKSFVPSVQSQGQSQSCVGWSLANALTMIEVNTQNVTDLTSINNERLSPMFIYNNIKKPGDCRVATSSLTDGLAFVKKSGVCEYKVYNPKDCSTMPTERLFTAALDHKITGYYKLFNRSEQLLNSLYVIKNVKQALSQGKPVSVGMKVSMDNFCNYQYSTQAAYLDPYTTGKAFGHAMVVIGYDDQEGAFELLNSFGTDWGNEGFCKVKYEDFAEDVKYGFVMYQDKPLQITGKNIAANVSFSYKPQKETKWTALSIKDSLGILYISKSLKVGDDVSFRVKPAQNAYIYILSTNTSSALEVSVPKKNPIASDSLLIFPEQNRMYIDRKGKHSLCILLSNQPIENINQVSGQPVRGAASIRTILETYFPDRIIGSKSIAYTPNGKKMRAESRIGEGYNIVPILLEIKGI